jgi:FkbM family methyltransferase
MRIQKGASWFATTLGHESRLVRGLRPCYEHAMLLMTLGRGISWSINGVPCRIDPRQRHRMARRYDEPVARWLSTHVKLGDFCANVGANVGVYALQFAHWTGPNGRVVVFEPNPHARTILAKHLRYNHLSERVKVVGAAVSDTRGEATLFAEQGGDGMSRLGLPNDALSQTVPIVVPVTDLDSFFENAPAWLVIDVEGFEMRVLRGARRIIRECKGIVVELHPASWGLAGTTRGDLESLLAEHSLKMTPLTGQTDPFTEHGNVLLRR